MLDVVLSYVKIDVTAIFLFIVVLVLATIVYLSQPPYPATHPFILGRQSSASTTRLPSESPTYTNSATGGIRPLLRPAKVRTLVDVVSTSNSRFAFQQKSHSGWVDGGEYVNEVVYAVRAGLLSTLGVGSGTVAVCVADPADALIVILALALTSYTPLIIQPNSSLPSGISADSITALIVSGPSPPPSSPTDAEKAEQDGVAAQVLPQGPVLEISGVKTITLGSDLAADLLVTGRKLVEEKQAPEVPSAEVTDVVVKMVAENGVVLEITHLNLTASLITYLSLFPASPTATRPTSSSHVLTLHPLHTPYGLTLSLFLVHSSATLLLLSTLPDKFLIPQTHILAPSTTLVQPLYTTLLKNLLQDLPFTIRWSRDGKLRLLRSGNVSKSTIWDSFLFNSVRSETSLFNLVAVVIAGETEASKLEFFRMALGVPVMTTYEHPLVAGPVLAAGMWDFQRNRSPAVERYGERGVGEGKEKAHVGAPAVGVEVKFVGEESELASGRIRGEILIRTPLLPQPSSLPASLLQEDTSLPQLPPFPLKPGQVRKEEPASKKWFRTGVRGEMAPEGVVWLSS